MPTHPTPRPRKPDPTGDPATEPTGAATARLEALLAEQNRRLAALGSRLDLVPCLLEKIGQIGCLTATHAHRNGALLAALRHDLAALLELYRTVHPAAALDADRLAKLRLELERCCPPEDDCAPVCVFEPCTPAGGDGRGDGYSMKSRGQVARVETGDEHQPWQFAAKPRHTADKSLPPVALGAFVGRLTPAKPTPMPQDFRSGGGAIPPGGQAPVAVRTFTETEFSQTWPPDMSGARGGDVVLMTGNLWLKLSVDGGKTFSDLAFNDLFAVDNVYGGWAGDQVVHYIPAIDCFVLYVQSYLGPALNPDGSANPNANKNVVKVALASQADLKKFAGAKAAWWRQWDFTSDSFGLGAAWMDFPDVTYGRNFLHVNTNVFAGRTGKLFFELPLAEMLARRGFGFLFAFIDNALTRVGSPAQNVQGDDFYWAAHVDNSKMLVYFSRGGDPNFDWREREVLNWPLAPSNNIVARAPDSYDWISADHRIIGATQVGSELWFAWAAAGDDGGYGGFKFPFPHIQLVKFDIAQDFKRIDQTQIWNADHAYSYPSLVTNSDAEVGISVAWGGGTKTYGSHAVGILGDFALWYGDASEATLLRKWVDSAGNDVLGDAGEKLPDTTRFGDYLHVRLAHPDTRYFGAFGYAVKTDPARTWPERGKFVYSYIEFGRPQLGLPPVR